MEFMEGKELIPTIEWYFDAYKINGWLIFWRLLSNKAPNTKQNNAKAIAEVS
jgi:hypothetical protein